VVEFLQKFTFLRIHVKLNVMGVFYTRCLCCCFNKNLSFFLQIDKVVSLSLCKVPIEIVDFSSVSV
jgi:hypothetical protein